MWNVTRLLKRLVRSVRVGSADGELEREVTSHIKLMEDDYRQRGLSVEEAARAARRDFGSIEAAKERQRDERAFRWIGETWQDFRYAARWLSKRPGFTLAAVGLLALGTGANTAMFSVVDAVLLRAVPFRQPHELFRLFQQPQGGSRMPVAPANFLDWRASSRSFQSMSAFTGTTFRLGSGAEMERVPGLRATANLFKTLGAQPTLGRVFNADEDKPTGAPVAVLGYALWSARFAGSRDILGTSVLLSGEPHTVIGVMPPDFSFPNQQTAIWVPLRLGDSPRSMSRTENYLGVLGRLGDGVGRQQAESDLASIAARLATAYPDSNRQLGIALRSLREYTVGNVETPLLVLMSAVVFVVLIAAVSVSNLLLAMSTGRQREIALRASLGASRGRIVRQLLTEATLLAVVGGIAGWLLAQISFGMLQQMIPSSVPGIARMTLDGAVLGFSTAVASVLGLVFGLAPALHMTRRQLTEGVHQGSRTSHGREVSRVRSGLLAIQVAFALILLVGAGLMLRTMFKLASVDLGFEPEHVLTASVGVSPLSSASSPTPDDAPTALAFQELLSRVRALPGVQAAGATSAVPTGNDWTGTRLVIEGHAVPPDGRAPEIDYSVVTPGYFEAMEIPLRRGRFLTSADRLNAPPVAVINDAMAARFYAGVDPVGRRVRRGEADSSMPWITIVGVVGDVHHLGVDRQPVPELFLPHAQVAWPELTMMVRSNNSELLTAPLRNLFRELGSQYELRTLRPLEQFVSTSIGSRRLIAQLLSLFAALATIIAAIGIYTVVTLGVVQRVQEFGVRIALGATMVDLAAMVLAQSAVPILAGIAIGLGAAAALATALGTMLYEVPQYDTASFGMAAAVLCCVGLVASLPPVRRVFKIDPATALRIE